MISLVTLINAKNAKKLLFLNKFAQSALVFTPNCTSIKVISTKTIYIVLKHSINLTNDTFTRLINNNSKNNYFIQIRKMAEAKEEKEAKTGKKPSKFKMFYRQYGPSFLVIHLATVVAWIYLFFLISKQ